MSPAAATRSVSIRNGYWLLAALGGAAILTAVAVVIGPPLTPRPNSAVSTAILVATLLLFAALALTVGLSQRRVSVRLDETGITRETWPQRTIPWAAVRSLSYAPGGNPDEVQLRVTTDPASAINSGSQKLFAPAGSPGVVTLRVNRALGEAAMGHANEPAGRPF